ncbi:uncharacterized protein [Drosophila kikkawai]|uniref:SEA domain-containing protein n=1 Tax=Drosophila kikkawai TaxID=30033 RepID=A0A6P4IXX6_DROKI|nr:uncharacterized protein LOC108082852 [Drosophila kikkawai]
MEASPEGNGNPEEKPNPNHKKGENQKKNNSQTETNSQDNTNISGDSVQEIQEHSSETLESRDSRTRSIGTTGSAHLSTVESQTSGFTTESNYPTAFGYEPLTSGSSSSFGSIQTLYGPPPTNFLREVHVEVNPSSSGEEIQSVRRDLQELLANAMFHIGGWNNQAIYIIAYNYM